MEITYAPSFIRTLKALSKPLQDEAIEKIGLFHNPENYKLLKVYKLRGRLKGRYSFSVNYKLELYSDT